MLFLLPSWVWSNQLCFKKVSRKRDLEWPGLLLPRCKTVVHYSKVLLTATQKKEGLNKLIYGLSTIFKVSICVIWKVTSVFFNFRLFKTVMTCPTMIIPPKGILLTPSCGNTYGTYCVFACENGYASRVGNVTRTCLESSLWSGENIKCTGTGTSLRFYFCMKVRQTNNWVMKGQTTINNKNNK